jgi:hypothetical protein
MCKRRLWKWASLFIGAPLGNLEGSLFTGNSERQLKEVCGSGASLSLCGSSVRGTWREGSFTGNSESYVRNVKEGFGNEASLSS